MGQTYSTARPGDQVGVVDEDGSGTVEGTAADEPAGATGAGKGAGGDEVEAALKYQ